MAALGTAGGTYSSNSGLCGALFAFAPDSDVFDRVLQGGAGHSVTLAAK